MTPNQRIIFGAGESASSPKVAAGAKRWVHPADCREGMRAIADNTVSLILTDPPYFIDGMGDDWNNQKLRKRTKPGVVGGIPAGQKFDSQQGIKLQQFMLPVAEECLRVLKPGGFVLCFSQPRLVHRAAMAIESVGFEIRDMLGWQYEGQAKAFSQEHFVRKMNIPQKHKEDIISQLEGRKTPQLKPQMELIVLAQKPREGTFVSNWLSYKTSLVDVSSPLLEPDRFPGTLMPCPKPSNRYSHLTAKPVDLCRHLIRIFGGHKQTGLVLDPFAGSGTTGVAAKIEGWDFIGYEIDVEMAEIAETRIRDTAK